MLKEEFADVNNWDGLPADDGKHISYGLSAVIDSFIFDTLWDYKVCIALVLRWN